MFDFEELKDYMQENNLNHLSEVEGAGFLGLSNHGGLTVLINSTGEGVFYQYYNNDIDFVPVEYLKNHSTGELEAGFIDDNGHGYILSEFLKVGW